MSMMGKQCRGVVVGRDGGPEGGAQLSLGGAEGLHDDATHRQATAGAYSDLIQLVLSEAAHAAGTSALIQIT